jgi:serine/threonine protein kinase
MTERSLKTAVIPPNTIGQAAVLGTRYELLNELGAGGMGRVYRARDRETNEILALKVLLPEFAADPAMAERFKNELRLARRITHKNVCRIYDFNRTDSFAYITMEYVDGETLRALLTRDGPLAPARVVEIATQICTGLGEAHAQGVVHRDLKPENVMITTSGQVKLMDFGIARSLDSTTTSHTMIGTPGYMAPEQAQGHPVTARTDIYAFGMIMYECLTGRPAFTGPTPIAVALKQMQERPTPPRALRPDIPPVLEVGVMRCLEKDPARRFPSADALAAALVPTPTSAAPRVNKPVVVSPQSQPAPSRIPWVLALVAIGVGAMWMVKHNAPTAPEPSAIPARSAIAPVPLERHGPALPPEAAPAPQVAPVAPTPFPEQPRFGSQEPGRFDRNDSRDAFPDRTAELERTRAAAEAGDAAAQMRLSQVLLNGPMEIRDEYQAREWMRRAAEQGVPEAQFAVAMMYDRGVGGSPDRRTALSWIERAAQSGHEGAQRILARAREQQPGQFPQRPPGSRPPMRPPR